MIAAIALAHAMTLATRNVRDFEGLGVPLVDPFRNDARPGAASDGSTSVYMCAEHSQTSRRGPP